MVAPSAIDTPQSPTSQELSVARNYSEAPGDRETYSWSVNRIGRRHVPERVAVWRHPRGLSAARVDEADLARLVTRDSMVGVARALSPDD